MKAFSTTGSIEGAFQGSFISFFPNGKRKLICNYDKGKRNGEAYEYFPNGKLYLSGIYKNDTLSVQNCSDSTGKVLVENGNGIWISYTDDFTRSIGQGPVKNGFKEGEWRGVLNDTISYTATMNASKVVTGVSITKKGNQYHFTKEFAKPEFTGGLEKFGQYLAKTIRYPEYAREHKIQGRALLMFNVDTRGSLYNIRPISGNELLVNEAMRVMQLVPRWVPATSYGVTVEAVYSVPISFTLAYENH